MSNDTQPANLTLAHALHLARAGFVVFPCRQGDKRPATNNGLLDATADEAVIKAWFATDRGLNLAVACGPQPNGVNLVAIDVDPGHGGWDSWNALLNGHTVPTGGPAHTTRSGGVHLFFDAPSNLHNTTGRLGVGIDTRGVGGYVVVPPSKVVDAETGEIGHYTSTRATALSLVAVPPLPDWLVDLLADQTESQARHPSNQVIDLGDSVADKARVGWRWEVELDADGWSFVRRRGEDSYWARPGKNPREGHSAVVADDGPLRVFTTECPGGGVLSADGVVRSYSPWDYIVAYRADGDTRVAAALVRGQPARTGVEGEPPAAIEGTPLFPPPEFYEQRPWMAAAAQMAYAVGGSPSAHLLAYLCRWATLIPPGYSIPPINGAVSSFDLLCVIAGTSGSGKTSPMRNAARMIPVQRKDLRMGLGIGSGEGVIEAFYGQREIERDDGKKSKERAKIIAGVNFAVSEGLIFAELSGRAGTTHVTRLCDAWSGSPLSTANASSETFRHIDEDQYRLTLMMGIQADMAYQLMTDSATAQGFVGRLLFAWAEEPRIAPRPAPPDPFVLPVPPAIMEAGRYVPRYLSYPDHVITEVQETADQRVGTNVPVEEHHHDLMRLKVAGIIAHMEGRHDHSTDEDWAIATTLANCSRNVRQHLRSIRRSQKNEGDRNQAIRRAEIEMTVDDEKERRTIAKIAGRIRTKATAAGAAGMGRSNLRSGTTTGKAERGLFDQALDLAIVNCWVRLKDGRVYSIE